MGAVLRASTPWWVVVVLGVVFSVSAYDAVGGVPTPTNPPVRVFDVTPGTTNITVINTTIVINSSLQAAIDQLTQEFGNLRVSLANFCVTCNEGGLAALCDCSVSPRSRAVANGGAVFLDRNHCVLCVLLLHAVLCGETVGECGARGVVAAHVPAEVRGIFFVHFLIISAASVAYLSMGTPVQLLLAELTHRSTLPWPSVHLVNVLDTCGCGGIA